MEQPSAFTWKFQRLGGLDQVTLRSAEELRRLRDLDPKLWTALSCPSSGLEFDQRTLDLLDGDRDGRIRIPEVLAAVEWLCECLSNPEDIVSPGEAMPLAAVNRETEKGRRLSASARAILDNLGKQDADALTQADVTLAAATAAQNLYNGDGIVPPAEGIDPEVRRFISDALAVMGGVVDAGGQPGIDKTVAAAFTESLHRWQDWKNSVAGATRPLGENSAEAWDLLRELTVKIDDYFMRCELAAFAPQVSEALNKPEAATECLAPPAEAGRHGLLDLALLADLPLARVEADRPLSLDSGLNPAWRGKITRLLTLIEPLLASPGVLSRDDWKEVEKRFAPYAEAAAKKPGTVAVEVAVPPSSDIDRLGDERVAEILSGNIVERFNETADKDAAVPAASGDIAEVERLVLYYLHLHRLLMNFVSFYDFYALQRKAMFQAGALYLDGRCCRLCLPVSDVEKHAKLASFSHLCLIYCQCRRTEKKGAEEKEDVMHIAAAMTAGNADMLMEGRNGVYVDSMGGDWDATVVKIVTNPISLWQSLWEPYLRFGRMVSEQIGKFASSKHAEIMDSASKKIQTAQQTVAAPPSAPAQPFDIGRSVGIFAAIGLALGAIGTAVASIANALFALSWWQFPLILVGLFTLISGPSFVLAWLKLRKRTLGPVLDASGWAVNSMVPINFTLGNALTTTAHLPGNAVRNYTDPLRRNRHWPVIVLLAALLLGAAGGWLWLNKDKLGISLPSFATSEQAPTAAEKAPATPPAQAAGGDSGAADPPARGTGDNGAAVPPAKSDNGAAEK